MARSDEIAAITPEQVVLFVARLVLHHDRLPVGSWEMVREFSTSDARKLGVARRFLEEMGLGTRSQSSDHRVQSRLARIDDATARIAAIMKQAEPNVEADTVVMRFSAADLVAIDAVADLLVEYEVLKLADAKRGEKPRYRSKR